MGTRNLTVFKADNEVKMAKYCQWDGLSGTANDVFLLISLNSTDEMRKALKNHTLISDKDKWKEYCINNKFIELDNDAFNKTFPGASRDFNGANIMYHLLEGKKITTFNQIDFAKDAISCEWTYYIDLDKETLRVVKCNPLTSTFTEAGTFTFDKIRKMFLKEFFEKIQEEPEEEVEGRYHVKVSGWVKVTQTVNVNAKCKADAEAKVFDEDLIDDNKWVVNIDDVCDIDVDDVEIDIRYQLEV